ncbi:interleukin-1 receptor type 1-like [Leptodactylus fuscus]|uniref:interleukin-1 receptor type 1-like n=1 Tax=Leptodactylus fuscus TaxID=238119 RepID=UPI003F4E6F27
MLGHLLDFPLHILTLLFLSVGKAEKCINDEVDGEIKYASVGEPLHVICPLHSLLNKNNFSVTWIRNDSQTEITSDKKARVHQDQEYLKFIPADLHDSGLYQCILRNVTHCIKYIRRVEVFKFDDGLCYKHSVRFRNHTAKAGTLTIQCPNLDKYGNYSNMQVMWFKECQPLNLHSKRYMTSPKSLTITGSSRQDSGNYTCKVPFSHNGVTYNISRTIEYTISDRSNKTEPVIIFPTNNIIDVELGAPITLTCKVLHNRTVGLLWLYNGTDMDFYADDGRVILGDTSQKLTEDGIQYFKSLTFTKVTEEDYNRQFYCGIWHKESTMFYVTLKRPDPNFQGFIIAFFLSVLLVLTIAIIGVKILKVDIVLWYRSSCFANTYQKDHKIYDAYVIYPKNSMVTSSYEMDIFVQEVLPEVLEKQCAYRLFILGRDDLPGQAIMDLVDESISRSRRVIIVLGNMICEERGDDFEQKIAMYDALIRNKIKVILIEMEKIIDYTNMPESIKYIKQKQGVVRWKGEFTEAALSPNTRFWKNIRYQMPPAQRHSDKELHYIYSED